MDPQYIRNFSIIAHVDHGKSTLADRLLERTGTIPPRQMRDQVLDRMDLERERGITIKMTPVRMEYHPKFSISNSQFSINDSISNENSNIVNSLKIGNSEYILNLIDTPGHIDFSYEVSRALHAVEGVLLLVDSTQGVQAQTLTTLAAAASQGCTVIPIVSKIDSPAARPEEVAEELAQLLHVSPEEVLAVSGRTGEGVDELLEAIVERIPPPHEMAASPISRGEPRGLIFDFSYSKHRGIAVCLRVFDGTFKKGQSLRFHAAGKEFIALEVGIFAPEERPADTLSAEEESSGVLGRGFRCGFLGLLHLEIVTERLRREFGLSLIVTIPTISYAVTTTSGAREIIYTPAKFPEHGDIEKIEEPWAQVSIMTPFESVSALIQMLYDHEAFTTHTETHRDGRIEMKVEMPLRELMRGFFDKLKSISSGYASLSYEILPERRADVVRLDVLVAEEPVPAFARVVARRRVQEEAEKMVEKLHGLLPKQLFVTKIQAKSGGRIIASRTLSAMRKDVTGYLYGGDVTRKMKLLEKQKKGKKKMLERGKGKVNIPEEVFMKMVQSSAE